MLIPGNSLDPRFRCHTYGILESSREMYLNHQKLWEAIENGRAYLVYAIRVEHQHGRQVDVESDPVCLGSGQSWCRGSKCGEISVGATIRNTDDVLKIDLWNNMRHLLQSCAKIGLLTAEKTASLRDTYRERIRTHSKVQTCFIARHLWDLSDSHMFPWG